MIYNNIIHNETIIKKLSKIIESKQISHSFLFHGTKHTGKIGHAIEFSAALLCHKSNNDFTACGKCISCDKIRNNRHENINYIYPMPAKSNLSTKVADELNNKLDNIILTPYHDNFENSNSILISTIRELKKNMTLSTINDNYQINIILESDKLCYPKQESANALLKILEEPNDKYIFILISSDYSKIIDTIKSRCNQIFFPKPSELNINNYLTDSYKLNENDAIQIAKICNGNMNIAISLNKNFDELLNELSLFLVNIYDHNFDDLTKYLNNFNKNSNQIVLLNLITIFFTDIILMNNNNEIKLFKLENLMNKFLSKFPNAKWNKIINEIQKFKTMDRSYTPLFVLSFIIELNKFLTNKKNHNILENYIQL